MIIVSAGGVDLDLQLRCARRQYSTKHAFGRGRAANVAHTDEQDAHTLKRERAGRHRQVVTAWLAFWQGRANSIQIRLRIDSRRRRHRSDIDNEFHPGLQRPQLLEFFGELQLTGRQRRHPLQRLDTVGVDAQVPLRTGATRLDREPLPRAVASTRNRGTTEI